jgi:hypothetical protein
MTLPKSETRKIYAFVDRVTKILRLPPWDIQLSTEPCESGAYASLDPMDYRYVATLKVADDWMDEPPKQKALTLTHECVHLMHNEVFWDTMRSLEQSQSVSPELLRITQSQFKAQLERMVDRLTDVIVTGYDLTWPEKGGTR